MGSLELDWPTRRCCAPLGIGNVGPRNQLSWEHRLDDFVTIDLRVQRSIEQEVTDASAEIDGRPPIHVGRPQGFNLEPYGLDGWITFGCAVFS